MTNQRFTVTEEHLKLLRRAEVRWDDSEYGAPAIDSKRPYGNSDVVLDILEILGLDKGTVTIGGVTTEIDISDMDEPPEHLVAHCNKLHQETLAVLQIALSTGSFAAGTYEAKPYSNEWKRVEA